MGGTSSFFYFILSAFLGFCYINSNPERYFEKVYEIFIKNIGVLVLFCVFFLCVFFLGFLLLLLLFIIMRANTIFMIFKPKPFPVDDSPTLQTSDSFANEET